MENITTAVKERPIIFSTDMVQSILEGRKTQTRRIIKNVDPALRCLLIIKRADMNPQKCPYGKPGDLLWVRERFVDNWKGLDEEDTYYEDGERFPHYTYYASCPETWEIDGEQYSISDFKWSPSIHMPKTACRIWLEITDIRVDRLNNINEEDAISEGIKSYGPFGEYAGSKHPNGGLMKYRAYDSAKRAFQCLWESIHSKESWDASPWVWVIDFKRIEKGAGHA